MLLSGDGLGASPAADETVQTPTAPAATFDSIDELRQWITEQAETRYGELFGTTFEGSSWGLIDIDPIILRPVLLNFAAADTTRAMSLGISETNVQVEGVDEADLVETDGDYLYMVTGGELVIVDIRDPENLSVASRVQLDSTPTGIYLTGDRLTLVSTTGDSPQYQSNLLFFDGNLTGSSQAERATVTVTVLDIADRESPTQVEQTEIDGALVSSRMVDGQLRLVTQQSRGGYIPSPRYRAIATEEPEAESGANSGDAMVIDFRYAFGRKVTYQYEALEEYIDRVVAEWAPSYRTLSVDGEVLSETFLVDPSEIDKPAEAPAELGYFDFSRQARTTIATFNVLDDIAGPLDTETLRTKGASTVYADGDNVYLFESLPTGNGITDAYFPPSTKITKFSFGEDGAIGQDATGTVSGYLINQFAADEHDGYLRVATTYNHSVPGARLAVLEQQGDQLVEVGAVEGLAPGEELHSVRFMGDEAYLVTFRVVDPLFAIDLSDPTAPTVEGELKVSGYSDYLHPIGEGHLLGIGREANIDSGYYEEMQVSIFGVTDPTDPTILHRYSIEGGRSTTSVATGHQGVEGDGDHHAIAYYDDIGVLTLSIQHQHSWGDAEPLFEPGGGGLLVLSIDVADGIEKLALIEHDTPITRSVRVGDTLIAISATQVSSHRLTDPSATVDLLNVSADGGAGTTELAAYVAPNTAESVAETAAETTPAPEKQVARVPFQPTTRTASVRSALAPAARTALARAAASDEALLLLADEASAGSEDNAVYDPVICWQAPEEAESPTTSRGVRQGWRTTVKA